LQKEIFFFSKFFYVKLLANAKLFEVENKLHFDNVKVVNYFFNIINDKSKHLKMQRNFFDIKTNIINKKNKQVIAKINKQR